MHYNRVSDVDQYEHNLCAHDNIEHFVKSRFQLKNTLRALLRGFLAAKLGTR